MTITMIYLLDKRQSILCGNAELERRQDWY